MDTPQSLAASFFYELPVGRGKPYLNQGGAVDKVVGGWYVSGILSYHSGLPTEVYSSCTGTAGDVLFGGCNTTGAGARVNIVPGVRQTNKSNFNPTTTPFWNPAAFTPAANCAVVVPCAFGNEPRSLATARGFAGKNEDITIGKKTGLIGEKVSFDFRASFFNIFNRHIFNTSSNVFGPPLQSPFIPAGGPGCSGVLACNFGAITSTSNSPRVIQFGFKMTY